MDQTTRSLAAVAVALLIVLWPMPAQQRPRWDQDAAVAKVKDMLRVEESGQPWDKIKWLEDPKEAAKRASASQKPLFVYCFLKTDSGPAAAPC